MTRYSDRIEALLGTSEIVPPPVQAGGPYDGADRFDRELATWHPALMSADGEILPHKGMADARSRDVLRNDSYVAGAADLHRDNIVGGMYLLNSKPDYKILGLDESWSSEFQEEVESKFTLFAESPENWIDASRMNSFTGLIRLAVGVYVAGGEILASVEWLRDRGRPYNTAIQMIDADRLSNPYGRMDDERLRAGVSRNKYGAPKGYWIRVAHPSDYTTPEAYRHKYVPARKPWGRLQVLHILEQLRPDQTRGISALVTSLKELNITKRFRDVTLQNAVVNATYAASIESDLPSEAVYEQLGGGNLGEGVSNYAKEYLGAIGAYSSSSRNLKIDGVKIPHLFPGTKLKMHPAGDGGPLGTEFEQSLLRYVASNLGVSYEQLSRDYSATNYSSIRAAMTETWKYMQSRKRMVADRFASHIFRLWLEETMNKGEIESLPRRAPSWYEGLNAEAYTACEWIGASRGQVDELKETQAAVLRLKNNLSTHEDEMARLGKDFRKTFAQRQREKDEMEERGLLVEEDGKMMNAVTGEPREKKESDRDNTSEDEDDE